MKKINSIFLYETNGLLYLRCVWRGWRYQSGNQNPYIAEEQKTQWIKEKVQKDKQRSTKHAFKPH